MNSATDAISWGIKRIETGGVLVDFLFVDMLGMVIPRTYQAYQRNKEELGHLNYKSGTEELIREIFSGPSMFVIPLGFIAASKKVLGESTNIQFKTLDSITDSFARVLKKDNLPSDKTQLKKEFFKNIIGEAFEKHHAVELDKPVDINGQVEKITEHLLLAEDGKDAKKNISAIKQIVSDLNKAHGIHLDNSHNVTLKDGHTKEIGALSEDLIKYSHDIVNKIADNVPKSTSKFLEEKLASLHKNKTIGRRGMLAATFLTTVGALYSIPILYQRNKQFPGIDGLVKEPNKKAASTEETPTFIKLEKKKQAIPAPAFSERKKKQDTSFGSSTPSFFDKFFKKFDFNGANVPPAVLGVYTLGIMLGARLYQARNADERREVATRDFSGLSTISFGLPIARNWISTAIKTFSGVPIAKPLKSLGAHFNPTKKPFTFENIEDIYSGPSKLKNGLVDFAQNISNEGGDLRKIFDLLSDESKNALNTVAQTSKTPLKTVESSGIFNAIISPFRGGKSKLQLPETNAKIVELFKKAQENISLKAHLDVIKKELDNPKNHIVKFAEAGKSLPEAASIVGISAFLGWFLPWFNINYTKQLYKEKNANKQKNLSSLVAA